MDRLPDSRVPLRRIHADPFASFARYAFNPPSDPRR
jgi:hypothetical protein